MFVYMFIVFCYYFDVLGGWKYVYLFVFVCLVIGVVEFFCVIESVFIVLVFFVERCIYEIIDVICWNVINNKNWYIILIIKFFEIYMYKFSFGIIGRLFKFL